MLRLVRSFEGVIVRIKMYSFNKFLLRHGHVSGFILGTQKSCPVELTARG